MKTLIKIVDGTDLLYSWFINRALQKDPGNDERQIGIDEIKRSLYNQYFSEAKTIKEIANVGADLKEKIKKEAGPYELYPMFSDFIDEVATKRMQYVYQELSDAQKTGES